MHTLVFRDADGLKHIYNNESGMIFPYSDDLLSALQKAPSEASSEDGYAAGLANKIYLAIRRGKQSQTSVSNYLARRGFRELVLKTTSQCNMRCKYCIYSEHYPKTSGYSNEMTSIEMAQRAVDLFFTLFLKTRQYNATREPLINFYGGEPLLNFEMIKSTVLYVEEKYGSEGPRYSITTNGLLLGNEAIASFLKEYDFSISVSVDGTKRNHDRYRKTVGGQPTYDFILENVSKYFSDYQIINTVCCYDIKSNLLDLAAFYEVNDRRNGGVLPPLLHANQIVSDYSDFYDDVTEDERDEFSSQSNELLSTYIDCLSSGKKPPLFCSALFSGDFFLVAESQKYIWGNDLFVSPTATCCPGDKLLVNPDGSLDLCERGPITRKPLGSVQSGFNFEAAQEIVNQYNANVLSHCSNCNVSRLCSKCYATTEDAPCYHLDASSCEAIRKTIEKRLSVYATIMERNPDAFNRAFA